MGTMGGGAGYPVTAGMQLGIGYQVDSWAVGGGLWGLGELWS